MFVISVDYCVYLRKFYSISSKTQLMERDVQISETVSYCIIYVAMLCQIMFGTHRDWVRSLNALLCEVLHKIV